MIYQRYLICEILKAAAAIFGVVTVIFASDCAVNYLGQAIAGTFPPAMVGHLILLRVGIAMEVILPVTFFLAVIVALGRLDKDLEMTAFSACGIGLLQVLKVVFVLSLPVAMTAAYASLCIRPEGWTTIYRVLDEAESQFDLAMLNPNAFLEIRAGRVVFFAREVHDAEHSAQNVFVRMVDGENRRVIRARQMIQTESAGSQRELLFRDGSLYEIPARGQAVRVSRFDQAHYSMPAEPAHNSRYRRKATPTEQLIGSQRLHDIAELQWRISAPLSTVLLGLFGVLLSRGNPRKGRFARVGAAIVVFAFYFQLFVIARTWVDKGVLPPLIGIWWVPALLSGAMLVLLWRSGDVFYRIPK